MGEPGQIALYGTDLFDNPIDRMRTGKQFRVSRKVGRAHQTMLVFIKGSPRTAAELYEGQGSLL